MKSRPPGDLAGIDEDWLDEVAELAAATAHFEQTAIQRFAQGTCDKIL